MFSAAGPLIKDDMRENQRCTSHKETMMRTVCAPVSRVELDAKVVVRSSRVVRSGQEDTTVGLVGSDDVRGSRGREDRVVADDELGDTVTGGEADDGLASLAREESAVTTNDERLAGGTSGNGVESSLDEVLGVVL